MLWFALWPLIELAAFWPPVPTTAPFISLPWRTLWLNKWKLKSRVLDLLVSLLARRSSHRSPSSESARSALKSASARTPRCYLLFRSQVNTLKLRFPNKKATASSWLFSICYRRALMMEVRARVVLNESQLDENADPLMRTCKYKFSNQI